MADASVIGGASAILCTLTLTLQGHVAAKADLWLDLGRDRVLHVRRGDRRRQARRRGPPAAHVPAPPASVIVELPNWNTIEPLMLRIDCAYATCTAAKPINRYTRSHSAIH